MLRSKSELTNIFYLAFGWFIWRCVMIETCERCGAQSAKLQKCDYCNRRLCLACI